MVIFCCCSRRVVFIFLLFGRVVFFFLLFGRGACFHFCCLGGACLFVAVYSALSLRFGRVFLFFVAVWAGDVFIFVLFARGMGVHSLTGLPGSSLRCPTTKKTKQPKKKTGFQQAWLAVGIKESHELI